MNGHSGPWGPWYTQVYPRKVRAEEVSLGPLEKRGQSPKALRKWGFAGGQGIGR